MSDLEYLEQAAAHADEGPIGEVAARSILAIALRLATGEASRWIRDEKTDELFERQADGSYRAAYKLAPLETVNG